METINDLASAVRRLLDHPLGIAMYRSAKPRAEKSYEAYLFGLCLEAVREIGIIPSLTNIENRPDEFIFRGSPGKIYSQSRNYGYASFSINNIDFELHSGIEIKGNSQMTHELDVCIIHSRYAHNSRASRTDPPAKSLVIGFECKFYSTTLPKSVGREFVGLVDDMGSKMYAKCLCSNSDSQQIRIYYQNSNRPDCYFNLTPGNHKIERQLVERIKQILIKASGAALPPAFDA